MGAHSRQLRGCCKALGCTSSRGPWSTHWWYAPLFMTMPSSASPWLQACVVLAHALFLSPTCQSLQRACQEAEDAGQRTRAVLFLCLDCLSPRRAQLPSAACACDVHAVTVCNTVMCVTTHAGMQSEHSMAPANCMSQMCSLSLLSSKHTRVDFCAFTS